MKNNNQDSNEKMSIIILMQIAWKLHKNEKQYKCRIITKKLQNTNAEM